MIIIIKIWMACWMFVNFDHIQQPLQDWFIKNIESMPNGGEKRLLEALFEVLGCLKCLCFWSVLILTLNPFYAIGASIVGQAYSKMFMH